MKEIEKLIKIALDYEEEFKTYIFLQLFYDFNTIEAYIDNFINVFIVEEIKNYPEGTELFNKFTERFKALDLERLEEEYQICLKLYRLT